MMLLMQEHALTNPIIDVNKGATHVKRESVSFEDKLIKAKKDLFP